MFVVRDYLLGHVDGVIDFVMGILMVVITHRQRARLENHPFWLMRALPKLSWFVLLFGAYMLLVGFPTSYSWRQVYTSDGFASAEFPVTPTVEEAVDKLGDISIKRTTTECEIFNKQTTLRLSWGELPPGSEAKIDSDKEFEQGLETMKTYYQNKGITVLSCVRDNFGEYPGAQFKTTADGGRITLARMVQTPKRTYRVIVVTTPALESDPMVQRFLKSFALHPK
jgi:hypothetical protein